MNKIRYYKGKYKIKRLTGKCSMGKALYESLETNDVAQLGEKIVIPVRLCWRHKK